MKVFDHDFPCLAEGTVIPYGIYDILRNEGFIVIGTSKDTSEFVCDSIRMWWKDVGSKLYADAKSILVLADGGGSNSSRHYIFKEDLQKLVNDLGIVIRMAHYPPYTSKWNPIEHRLFPYITRSLQGVILRTHQIVKELMEKTKTKMGLKVRVKILDKIYKTARKYAHDFKEKMPLIFDKFLGKWNYTAIPQE